MIRPRRRLKPASWPTTANWNVLTDESGIHLINLPPVSYIFKEEVRSGLIKASLLESGIRLEMRCINRGRKLHGEITELKWRAAEG